MIHNSNSFWNYELVAVIKNNEQTYSGEKKSSYWLSYDGLKKSFSMNPYGHLEPEQTVIYEKRHFLLTIINVYVIMVT